MDGNKVTKKERKLYSIHAETQTNVFWLVRKMRMSGYHTCAYPCCPFSSRMIQLVGCSRQGPRAPHSPDWEGVTQALVRHVAAARPPRIQLVAL